MPTVVLSAHGELDTLVDHRIVLPIKLTTSCRFGEAYIPKHLKFSDLGIFSNTGSLHEYIMGGEDYNTQGIAIAPGSLINNVVLRPFTRNDPEKSWSWQKPHVVNHLTKMCIYELADIRNITFFNDLELIRHSNVSDLDNLMLRGPTSPKLALHVGMLHEYANSTHDMVRALIDTEHACSLTKTRNGLFYMFDYEIGPSCGRNVAGDGWNILDSITGICNYLEAHHGVPLSGEGSIDSVVLQTCLEPA
jgi:hypothetical protein